MTGRPWYAESLCVSPFWSVRVNAGAFLPGSISDMHVIIYDCMTEPRKAIVASDGTYTYEDLDDASRRVAGCLLGDNDDLRQTRVAFLVAPSCAYAAVQRGIWRAGGVAVPLAVSHPPAELEYVIRDSGASVVVAGSLGSSAPLKLASKKAVLPTR